MTDTKSNRQADQGNHIPLNYTRILARVLDLKEREVGVLFEGTELKPGELYQNSRLLTITEQMQILSNGLKRFPDQTMGLRMGKMMVPSVHGPMGYMALSSPNLQAALETLADYLPGVLGFVRIWVEKNDQWLECKLAYTREVDPQVAIAVMEIFVLTVQALVEAVTGQEQPSAQFQFAYPRPFQADKYSEYLHSGFEFDADFTCYRVPQPLSDTPNVTSDHEHFRFAKQQCEALLAAIKPPQQSTADKVKAMLLNRPQVLLTEDEAAERLLISVRSLARRLASEGTSFRKLRDETLSELAARYLANQTLSVEVIAELLGYHDSASFRRAFKRWHGVTPSEFRETL